MQGLLNISAMTLQLCIQTVILKTNSSDGRMVRASASAAIDSGLIRVGPNQSPSSWYTQLPSLTLSIKGTVSRTSQQVYLFCGREKHLAGFLRLVWYTNEWQLLSELVIALRSLSRDRRINRTRTTDRRKLTAKNSSVRCIVAKMLRALNNLTRLENRLTAGSRFGQG